MPPFLIPLLVAALLIFGPVAVLSTSIAQAPSLDLNNVELLHYTRAGIVRLNRTTGASRFIPYRMAGDLDRRSMN